MSRLVFFFFFIIIFFFFFKQKTAYEIVSRDWSSDVCSSDLVIVETGQLGRACDLKCPTSRSHFDSE